MGACNRDFVFLIACGAMGCVECAHHVSAASYTAVKERPASRRYRHAECNSGWTAETTEEENYGG